jgi:hypothetical protein
MSSFEPDGGDFMAWANDNAKGVVKEPSILEIIQANITMQIDEHNINSSWLHNRPLKAAERDVDIALEENGISKDFIDSHIADIPGRGYVKDYEFLTKYVNEKLDPINPIPLRSKLIEERDYDLSLKRKMYNDIMERASGVKALTGGLVGSVIGTAVDPYTIATSLVAMPAIGIRSTSRAMYTASNFVRGTAFNAALAAPVEPFVFAWKEEIGADEYTLRDSLANVLASGILGGTVSGIGANLGHRFAGKSFLSRNRNSLVESFKKLGLDDADAETLGQYQWEINNAPDRNMAAKEFVERMEETQERMNNEVQSDEGIVIDSDNEELINKMYNEVEDDFIITFEDGKEVSFKEHASTLENDLDEITSVIGCLHGK